jgi:hypothetical protein
MNNKNNDIFSGMLGLGAVIVMIGKATSPCSDISSQGPLVDFIPNQEIIDQARIRGSILKSIITVKNNTE